MTDLEQILLDTTRERALALRDYSAANKAVKQAEAGYNNANKVYQAACHMHTEAVVAFEAKVLGEES